MDDNQERKDFSSTESDSQLSADEETLLDQLGIVGAARRKFLGQSMAALLGTFAFHLLAKEEAFATLAAAPDAVFAQTAGVENAVKVLLKINGSPKPGSGFAHGAARRPARNTWIDRHQKRMRSRTVRRLYGDR